MGTSLGVNELNHECAVVWYFKGWMEN